MDVDVKISEPSIFFEDKNLCGLYKVYILSHFRMVEYGLMPWYYDSGYVGQTGMISRGGRNLAG